MKVILVRHGDAKNQDGVFHGVTNVSLTKEGEDEAYDAAQRVKGLKPSIIYSSPVRRAAQTATIISQVLGIPMRIAEELKPLDLGQFVGKDIEDNLDKVRYYLENQGEKIPKGQSVSDWRNRYAPFFNKFFHNKSDQSVLFATHGRNFILTKSLVKKDPSILSNETQSSEHGGIAIATPPNKFEMLDAKSVKPGQS